MALMRLFCFLFCSLFAFDVRAQESFDLFLKTLGDEAIQAGINPTTVSSALATVTLDEQVLELDQKQPEKKISFQEYLKNALHSSRIKKGKAYLEEHHALLSDLHAKEGVPPAIIIALWGSESSFGDNTGHFSVLDSLATLAFEGRRADFFKQEFFAALKIIETEGMAPDALEGSWAGAMGQCQFMPSTFLKYAVDGDGDGKRDIWNNESDTLASIAHYLAAEGWQRGMAWGREVDLMRPIPPEKVGLENQESLAVWASRPIRKTDGKNLSPEHLKASLIQPDGVGGRSFLVYDNFRALMRWNRSTYFATSIGLLADLLNASK